MENFVQKTLFEDLVKLYKNKHRKILKESIHPHISLFLNNGLDELRYENVCDVLRYLSERYKMDLEVVGGGYGCSELVIAIAYRGSLGEAIKEIAYR